MKSTILRRAIIYINLHDAVVVTDVTYDSDFVDDFVDDSDADSDVIEIIEVDVLFSKISTFFKVDLSFYERYQTLASFLKAFELFIRRS
jgi:hypothetical protein